MNDAQFFLMPFAATALAGYLCRSSFARRVFWTISVISLVVVVALFVFYSIDVSMCKNWGKLGYECPPEMQRTFKHFIFQLSNAAWFWGGIAVFFLGPPTAAIAAVVEIFVRLRRGSGE